MSTFAVSPTSHPRSAQEREEILADPGFGKVFSDHMAVAHWNAQQGWHDQAITAYAPFPLDPATAVLHYAQSVFEGLKAFVHPDGTAWCFRPEANAHRFAESCRRLALPQLPIDDFIESLRALVETDRQWMPTGIDQSLYLRPFMFGSTPSLNVAPATDVTYCCIASPSAGYFGATVDPVSIWFTVDYTRAAPGGTGAVKCGGNYAASLAAQAEAQANGCSQVGFVDATEHRWIEELGGMNLFAVTDNDEVLTPPLGGTILPGVTRDATLTLAAELGLTCAERPLALDEVQQRVKDGSIREMFACGTAAVITPIGEIVDSAGALPVGDKQPGAVTMRLRETLMDIQYGRQSDTHGWLTQLA